MSRALLDRPYVTEEAGVRIMARVTGLGGQSLMLNFRGDDLDGLLTQVRKAGSLLT